MIFIFEKSAAPAADRAAYIEFQHISDSREDPDHLLLLSHQ